MRRHGQHELILKHAEVVSADAVAEREWEFVLRTITPVMGGGVRTWEPDAVDGVRLAGVRGQLRQWWRWLFAPADPTQAEVDKLFEDEVSLWGGIGTGHDDRQGNGSTRSRVILRMSECSWARDVPAGEHARDHRGGFKALPMWRIGAGLGYALFPLQIPHEERRRLETQVQPGQPLGTRSVRQELKFNLHVSLIGRPPKKPGERREPPSEADIQQVLATLWAWTHLGGIGARIRRGFGAISVVDTHRLPQDWHGRFLCLTADDRDAREQAAARLAEILKGCAPHPRSRLAGARIYAGPVAAAGRAHEELVSKLQTFRQGLGVGRDPGNDSRNPRKLGESRWPEPDLLRLRRGLLTQRDCEHPPSEAVRRDGEKLSAPRAAFGLPIQVTFLDRGDSQANAELVPVVAGKDRPERWASPVLLRPFPLAGGRVLPLVITLGGEGPAKVAIRFRDHHDPAPAPVREPEAVGAQQDIRRLLKNNEGDAVRAFEAWLMEAPHQYVRIDLKRGSKGGGS